MACGIAHGESPRGPANGNPSQSLTFRIARIDPQNANRIVGHAADIALVADETETGDSHTKLRHQGGAEGMGEVYARKLIAVMTDFPVPSYCRRATSRSKLLWIGQQRSENGIPEEHAVILGHVEVNPRIFLIGSVISRDRAGEIEIVERLIDKEFACIRLQQTNQILGNWVYPAEPGSYSGRHSP